MSSGSGDGEGARGDAKHGAWVGWGVRRWWYWIWQEVCCVDIGVAGGLTLPWMDAAGVWLW
jgi:hypothetical protein